MSGTDPGAKVAKMIDGTPHLVYQAEHVVDLGSAMILGAEITPSYIADTQSLEDSLHKAQVHLEAAGSETEIRDVAADEGYHATNTFNELDEHTNYGTYVPEPKSPSGSNWSKYTRK
jgi:hypothetical protein